MVDSVETRAARELERRVLYLQENGEGLIAEDDIVNGDNLSSNVVFARQLQLINEEQAREFLLRIQALEENRLHLERTETRYIVNDFENPLEREQRYFRIDEAARQARNARTSRERPNNETSSTTQIKHDKRSVRSGEIN